MTTLCSLPEELVGYLYSLLPDRVSRKAFYASTTAVCHAPSVLHQIAKLTVIEGQLDALEKEPADFQGLSSNPLLSYPHKAPLRHLVIQTAFYPESFVKNPKPKPSVATLLPQNEDHRLRVQALFRDLEVLEIKCEYDYMPYTNEAACRLLGDFVRVHACNLQSVKLPGQFPPCFLQALSAGVAIHTLRRLEVDRLFHDQDLKALSHFTHLEHLQCRNIAGSISCGQIGIDQFRSTMESMHQLKSLNICRLTPDMVAALPPSIECISFTIEVDSQGKHSGLDAFASLLSNNQSLAIQEVVIRDFCVDALYCASDDALASRAIDESLGRLAHCLNAIEPTLTVSVGRLAYFGEFPFMENDDVLHPLFWPFCLLFPTNLRCITICRAKIRTAEMLRLTECCPQTKELRLYDCHYEDSFCMSAAVEGLIELEKLDIFHDVVLYPDDVAPRYLPGIGSQILSACACLSPSRKGTLKVKAVLRAYRNDAYHDAARQELHAMISAWENIHRRLRSAGGACQPVVFEVDTDW